MQTGAQLYFEDDFSEDVNDSDKWLIVSGTWTMDDETAIVSPGGSGHVHMLVAEDLWDDAWTDYTIEVGVWVNTSADVFFKYAQMPGEANLDNYSWEIRTSTSHVIKYVGGAKTKPVDTTSTPGVATGQDVENPPGDGGGEDTVGSLVDRTRSAFFTGARVVLTIFLFVGFFFAVKYVLTWTYYRFIA